MKFVWLLLQQRSNNSTWISAHRQPADRFINTHINPGSFSLDLFPQLVVTPRSLLSELPFDKLISLRKQRPACVHSTGAKRTRSPVTEVRVIQTSALQDTAYLPLRTRCQQVYKEKSVRHTRAPTTYQSDLWANTTDGYSKIGICASFVFPEEKTDWCVPMMEISLFFKKNPCVKAPTLLWGISSKSCVSGFFPWSCTKPSFLLGLNSLRTSNTNRTFWISEHELWLSAAGVLCAKCRSKPVTHPLPKRQTIHKADRGGCSSSCLLTPVQFSNMKYDTSFYSCGFLPPQRADERRHSAPGCCARLRVAAWRCGLVSWGELREITQRDTAPVSNATFSHRLVG